MKHETTSSSFRSEANLEGCEQEHPARLETGRLLPLSSAQLGIWFAQKINPLSPAYNIGEYVEIHGPIDPRLFERALRQVVKEAETLSIRLLDDVSEPRQLVGAVTTWPMPYIDLSAEDDAQAAAEAWMKTDLARPVDLLHGPLFGYALFKAAPDRYFWYARYHHLIMDGFGMSLVARRLSDVYAASIDRGAPDDSCFDSISSLLEEDSAYRASRQLVEDRQYWAQSLAECPDPTYLKRYLAPPEGNRIFARSTSYLKQTLVERLEEVAKREGRISLPRALVAVMAIFVHRLTGVEDLVLSLPVSARSPVSEHVPGMTSNVLPLRLTVQPNMTVGALFAQTAQRISQLKRHQFYQIADLRRDLGRVDNRGAFGPFANIMRFKYNPRFAGHRTSVHNLSLGPVEDIQLAVYDRSDGQGLRIDFDACVSTYSLEEIAGYQDRFLRVLAASLDVDQPIGRLDIFDAAERHQVLYGWNATEAPFPADVCIQELFEAQVARSPDAIAVVFENVELSYADLNAHANRLAHHLVDLGVKPDARVAVALERSPQLVVAVLAVLKAGGAYVPLDPSYPAERLAFMIEDSAPHVLLTQQALLPALGPLPTALQVLALDDNTPTLASRAATNPDPAALGITHRNLAYVIYTSGSTGTPKGVMVEHHAVVKLVINNGYAHLGHSDRVAFAANPSFDASTFEIWAPLLNGGTMVVVDRTTVLDPAAFILKLQREGVTVLWLTVSLFNHYARILCPIMSQFRYLIVGGEALNPQIIRSALSDGRPQNLLNGYGPTETTTFATTHKISKVDDCELTIPIGRPISNTRIYILDLHRQPVPVGVAGEIYIGGAGVARGYLNSPELTAERFLPDPFAIAAGEAGARMYKTGDLGCWLPGGTIEFLGRNDHQVKIRGFRIELGEIEARLLAYPGLREAVVLAREDRPGDKRLVAYLVAESAAQGQIDLKGIRQSLALTLPDYMIPSAFVVLDALPLTANGKLDRKALPAPEDSAVAINYVAPLTPEGVRLCDLVAELLGTKRVGLADNFFYLGGHSLMATRLAAEIRARFGRELSIRTIFDNPVLGDLARALATSSRMANEQAPLVADPGAGRATFPLTPVQEAYWLGRQSLVELSEVACHIYTELKLRTVDLGRLTWAWRAVIDRHPMLRAVIGPDGSQRILSGVPPFNIAFTDYSNTSRTEAEAAARVVRETMSHQVLPCDRWPLFEVRVTRVAPEDWRLQLNIDALILDGESYNLLLKEVFDLYHGRITPGHPSELTFRDYVLHLQAPSAAADRALAYWKDRLDALPPAPDLPLAIDPSRVSDPRFGRHQARLAPEIWNKLKARAAAAGLTPSNLTLTAYAEVLGTWARYDDFTLNLTVDDRRPLHPEVAEMLGVFTNLIPLEIRGARRGNFRERALAQQRQFVRDLDHRAVTGVEVQRMLAQRIGNRRAGLLPVVFTSLIGEAQADLADDRIEIVHALTETPQVWLDNKVYETDGALSIDWDAPTSLFPPGLLDTMFDAYVDLLHNLANSDTAWDAVNRSLVPAAEHELIAKVNATAGPRPKDLLHEAVFAAAEAHPTTIAIIDEDRTLSFGELRHRALALARELKVILEPDDRLVAIVMEKGFEQIVAALAVLETGRAFLPISAGQPDQRIQAILSRAEARKALTQTRIQRGRRWQDKVVVLDVARESVIGSHAPRLPQTAAPEDIAYVIYTSGSTGTPKGVAIQHCAARNTIADLTERFALTKADRVLWVSSFEFDLSIFDIFGILGAGGTVVVPPPDANQNPHCWAEAVQQHGVTIWNSVPAIADLMLTSIRDDASARLASLRLVMFSGDWIPVTLPDRIKRQAARAQIISLGGATEASIWSIFYPIDEVDPSWVSIPYGKPLRNQGFQVLKDDFSPCPIHATGKLFITGVGLAVCYWNDPEQTAARFVHHPQTGERLYDTGDVGRYRSDGTIEFLGRYDTQVKIRGFRIELGEIESQVLSDPAVADCVVVATGKDRFDQKLVAYVVPKSVGDGGTSPEQIRAQLRITLPDYMLPAHIVFIEAMPLTSNGKLDRKELAQRQLPDVSSGRAAVGGITPLEAQVARLIAEVLEVSAVGPEDNFFDLGGHSLLALKLAAIIEKKLGRPMPPATIFTAATARSLATYLDGVNAGAQWKHLIPLNLGGTHLPVICLHGWEGTADDYLNLAHDLEPDFPVYGLRVSSGPEFERVNGSIETLAAWFEAEIRRLQPKGPYQICGYSFAGMPAFELAQKLKSTGDDVTLILLDAHRTTPLSERDRALFPRIKKIVAAKAVLATAKWHLKNLFQYELHYWLTGYDRDIKHGLVRSAERLKYTPFSGRTILVMSTGPDSPRSSSKLLLDGYNGWKKYIESIEVIEVRCGHHGLMKEPTAGIVARQLKSALLVQ